MKTIFNIRKLRKQNGLTLRALSDRSGVSLESVRVLDTYNHPKSILVLEKVLKVLGYEVVLSLDPIPDLIETG